MLHWMPFVPVPEPVQQRPIGLGDLFDPVASLEEVCHLVIFQIRIRFGHISDLQYKKTLEIVFEKSTV